MVLIAIAACLLAMPTLISVAVLLVVAARRAVPCTADLVSRSAKEARSLLLRGIRRRDQRLLRHELLHSDLLCTRRPVLSAGRFSRSRRRSPLARAWASLATAADAVPRRSPVFAWILVVLLTVVPLVTLWTLWPIRLLFLAARPEMEQLADQAVAGQRLRRAAIGSACSSSPVRSLIPLQATSRSSSSRIPTHPRGFLSEADRHARFPPVAAMLWLELECPSRRGIGGTLKTTDPGSPLIPPPERFEQRSIDEMTMIGTKARGCDGSSAAGLAHTRPPITPAPRATKCWRCAGSTSRPA